MKVKESAQLNEIEKTTQPANMLIIANSNESLSPDYDALLCPYCGCNYNHIRKEIFSDARCLGKALQYRNDTAAIFLQCEDCECLWALAIGEHKGNVYLNRLKAKWVNV